MGNATQFWPVVCSALHLTTVISHTVAWLWILESDEVWSEVDTSKIMYFHVIFVIAFVTAVTVLALSFDEDKVLFENNANDKAYLMLAVVISITSYIIYFICLWSWRTVVWCLSHILLFFIFIFFINLKITAKTKH